MWHYEPAKGDIEEKLGVTKYESRRIKTIQVGVETRERVEDVFIKVQVALIKMSNQSGQIPEGRNV